MYSNQTSIALSMTRKIEAITALHTMMTILSLWSSSLQSSPPLPQLSGDSVLPPGNSTDLVFLSVLFAWSGIPVTLLIWELS